MPLCCVSSFFVLDLLEWWINSQLVLNHLPGDPRHIWYLPRKNIQIFLEKSDECEFLFEVEIRVDPELLVWLVRVSQDLHVFFHRSPLLLVVCLLIGERLSGCWGNASIFLCCRCSRGSAGWSLGCWCLVISTATLCFGHLFFCRFVPVALDVW
jgi:hypothetical protein